MKCFYYEHSDGVQEFYWAEDRNKARKYFADQMLLPYLDVKVYRAEWADDYDERTLTSKMKLDRGLSVYCNKCFNIIDANDVYYTTEDGKCHCRKCHMINKVKGFFGK